MELLIVIAIIGGLLSITYPSLAKYKDISTETDRTKHEYVVNKALRAHYALTGTYPNQAVHDSSIPNLTPTELSTLAVALTKQTGVNLNTAKYNYTYASNGSVIYDVSTLHVDLK